MKAELKRRLALQRDHASTRKDGLTMVQVRLETRILIKQMAAALDQTIPEFMGWVIKQCAEDAELTIPESYKTERIMDHQLNKGNFTKIEQKQPKITDDLIPALKQWEKMCEDGSWEDWMQAWEVRTGQVWPGYENFHDKQG